MSTPRSYLPAFHSLLGLFSIGFALFGLWSCSKKEAPPVGPEPSGPRDGVLYVVEGGRGDGSREFPFGTVQRAIEFAFQDPSFRQINVGIGRFPGFVRVRTSLTITGGLDPANDWQPTNAAETILEGGLIDSIAVGVMVRRLSGPVTLNNLTLLAPDAVNFGETSYALYCQMAADVRLNNCTLRPGLGFQGENGEVGDDGPDGQNGFREYPGTDPVSGGLGGAGGPQNPSGISPGSNGARGYCPDRTQTGGLGGAGGSTGDGFPGEAGPDGAIGEDGPGGQPNLLTDDRDPYLLVAADHGVRGEDGEAGCGGGGGGGSASIRTQTFAYPGWPGGGGGSPGYPGLGGFGGQGGGSSVGIMAVSSGLTLRDCAIEPGDGARGGNGARGGVGGSGGIGGHVNGIFWQSGDGGPGGHGGNGGHGGGGAGGWSIGLVLFDATVDTADVRFDLGAAGQGGSGGAAPSSDGLAGQSVESITIE